MPQHGVAQGSHEKSFESVIFFAVRKSKRLAKRSRDKKKTTKQKGTK